MSNKVIIEVRINEYAMREPNPNVPYSPEEIATQSLECWREGASIIQDMNEPVPESLHGRFDLVLEAGSLEQSVRAWVLPVQPGVAISGLFAGKWL